MRIAIALWLGGALMAAPALALVVENDAGSAAAVDNAAPEEDFGLASIGRRDHSSAVHLRDGWVLSAAHVGVGEVDFGGRLYRPLIETAERLVNVDDIPTDLLLFRVTPSPQLPPLEIIRRPVLRMSPVVFAGWGLGIGSALDWHGVSGYQWNDRAALRWGTNHVQIAGQRLRGAGMARTFGFETQFDRAGSPREAQASWGDSGGAVFVKRRDGWKLAGIILTVTREAEQPGSTALYGNDTQAADLSYYREQIQTVMQRWEPAATEATPR